MREEEEESFRARIYAVVRQIPRGKVATYGQVAALAGKPRAFRACGSLLGAYLGQDLPWQRVLNAQGRVSQGGDLARPLLQRSLLEAEGVHFRRSGSCDLRLYRWSGPDTEG